MNPGGSWFRRRDRQEGRCWSGILLLCFLAVAPVVLVAPTVGGGGLLAEEVTLPGGARSLRVERLSPQLRSAPVERLEEGPVAASLREMIGLFQKRSSLLGPMRSTNPGRVIGAADRRQSLGTGDEILFLFPEPLKRGDLLVVFRRGEPLRDPIGGEDRGTWIAHVGNVRVIGRSAEAYVGEILTSFEAIYAGDFLERYAAINTEFSLVATPPAPLVGRVLKIAEPMDFGADGMVIIVGVGRRERAVQGVRLSVIRSGETVDDPVSGEKRPLPGRKIGSAVIFQVGERASFALLVRSTDGIRVGDGVTTEPLP
ncbi:MAG: hypothetical protein HQL59_12180 [Magnetococcales bacterium]|nr:hypothetical protein [Magnetococcales bacterium]